MIYWKSDQVRIGDEKIDEQNLQLFKSINDLHNTFRDGLNQKRILEIVKSIQKYSKAQFRAEEALMKRVRFPGLAEQQADHRRFIDELAQFRTEVEGDTATLKTMIEFFSKLGNWLPDHVSILDRQFGEYMKVRTEDGNKSEGRSSHAL